MKKSPDLIYGDGDGTVNVRSLKGCEHWKTLQKKPISTLQISNGDHFEMLSNQQVVNYILGVLVMN
jgi:lysophospholipase III